MGEELESLVGIIAIGRLTRDGVCHLDSQPCGVLAHQHRRGNMDACWPSSTEEPPTGYQHVFWPASLYHFLGCGHCHAE